MKHEMDRTFAALADPTRRAILARLSAGEASAGALSEPFEISQPAISRHLKVLEEAGLIRRRVAAQHRLFSLAPDALEQVDPFLDRLRQALETNYARLDNLLDTLQTRRT